jgi:hypothetical protein
VNRLDKTLTAAGLVASIATAGILYGSLGSDRARHGLRCPTGYLPREVRIEHQRLEAGLPNQGPVVTPNTWPEDNAGRDDRRYLVALVCVRPVTDAERHSEPYTDAGATP